MGDVERNILWKFQKNGWERMGKHIFQMTMASLLSATRKEMELEKDLVVPTKGGVEIATPTANAKAVSIMPLIHHLDAIRTTLGAER